MLAIVAAILFAVGYILDASAAHTNAWLSPGALTLAGLFCLALHLCGVGATWTRRPPQ
jgi:hypothetical protein